MNRDKALQTFIIDAGELLGDMETALLRIEQFPDDADTINALFRAAQTIKASAGRFGFAPIVALTHVAERMLDKVRHGLLLMTPDLAALLLGAADHLTYLIACIADSAKLGENEQQDCKVLVARLSVYLVPPAFACRLIAPRNRPALALDKVSSAATSHPASSFLRTNT